ncbi:hypothetical protein L6261_03950 [Candidatus Parcubacteria bacterium]|nr:hypothetical protein [Candidatus Parcubacteria bacterium]
MNVYIATPTARPPDIAPCVGLPHTKKFSNDKKTEAPIRKQCMITPNFEISSPPV